LNKPSSSKPIPNIDVQYKEKGLGEYSLQESCYVGALPLSPKSYNQPSVSKFIPSKSTITIPPSMFIKSGMLEDEAIDDISSWIFLDKNDQVTLEVEHYNNGFRIIKSMG